MAHTPYQLDILTPEGLVFSGEVEFVSSRTESGSIGIYARHQPLLALLTPAELRVTLPGGEIKRFAQAEGYVQVSAERVLLLVEEAYAESELTVDLVQEKLAAAVALGEKATPDSEEAKRAERDQRRYEAFLEVLQGSKAAA
jgi:F-type H+-transporting ATPase subunit epsilon